MSELSSIGSAHGRAVGTVHGSKPSHAHHRHGELREPAQPATPSADRIELSDHARQADQLDSDVRADLVARMRRLVNDPNYLTDQKLGAALDRMIEEIDENNAY